jgi:hypothetical protein
MRENLTEGSCMMRRCVVLIAALCLLAAGPAEAKKNGFYLGASVGASTVSVADFDDDDLGDIEFSDSGTGYKIFAGYRFLTFLAVEGSYVDLGSRTDVLDSAVGEIDAEIAVTGWDLFAVGVLPIGPVDLFAKVGGVRWDADLKASLGDESDRESDSGTDMAYGVGVGFRLWRLALRGEFEMFDIEGAEDVYMVSLGAAFVF